MNSKVFFIILLILAGVVVFGLTTKPKPGLSATAQSNAANDEQTQGLAPQSKTMGAVEITATPISTATGKEVVFELSMNTHSVELNYDYTKVVTLADDRGNTYQPTKWTGGNSGHHLKGELVFAALSGNPKELTLTARGIDNETIDFVWQL